MTINNKFAHTRSVSIFELLHDKSEFIVPSFQRNYSWDDEKVNVLWNDILANFETYEKSNADDRDTQYLLGSLVLVRENKEKTNEFIVVDGQQRLATITMIFCVARDIIKECVKSEQYTVPEGLSDIERMIENKEVKKENSWKLRLNNVDAQLYSEIQSYEEDEYSQRQRMEEKKVKGKSLNLLKKNYLLLNSKMSKFVKNSVSNDDEKGLIRLNYFMNYLQNYNFVVQIVVDDDHTAFQIFETLNDRGESLSRSNLVKNHMLKKVNKNEREKLSTRWDNIIENIAKQDDDEFLIESFRSREPEKIAKKDLYKRIKDKLVDEKEVKKYVEELEEDVEFIKILNVNNSKGAYLTGDVVLDDHIRAIKALGAKFVRSAVIAADRQWNKDDTFSKDFKNIVYFLVKWFFQVRTVCRTSPGTIEDQILDAIEMINTGKSYREIVDLLKKDNDIENFNSNFKKTMLDPSDSISRYVLQQINLLMNDDNSDVRPIDNLTLEHVLPRNSTGIWDEDKFLKNADDPDAPMSEYVKRLGNLTLLSGPLNASIGNKTFEEKKFSKGYMDSKLSINKDTVVKHNEWNAKIIKEREDMFRNYACNIWDLSTF